VKVDCGNGYDHSMCCKVINGLRAARRLYLFLHIHILCYFYYYLFILFYFITILHYIITLYIITVFNYWRYPQAKYYIQVDDDSYLAMPNLYRYLRKFNANMPHYSV
jgi:hypothetical protein